MTAFASGYPPATSSSSALSRQAVSDWPCGMSGHILSRSGPRRSDSSVRRRAFIQLTLPRTVLIRSEEHTSELQSLMRISYAVFCLKKKKKLAHESRQIADRA